MTIDEFKKLVIGSGWSRNNVTDVDTAENRNVTGVCHCISTHASGFQITYSEYFTVYNVGLGEEDYECWNSEYSFHNTPKVVDYDGFVLEENELQDYIWDLKFFKEVRVDIDMCFKNQIFCY